MTDQDIAAIADNFSNEFGLEVKEMIPFARAIIEADRAEQGRALHQAGANDMTDNHPRLPSPKYGPDTTVDEDDDPRGVWSYGQARAAIDEDDLAARGAVPAGWPRYTSEMGAAADKYINKLGGRSSTLPAQFRWEECLVAMLAAAPQQVAQPSVYEQVVQALAGLLEQVEVFVSAHGEADFETAEALRAVEAAVAFESQVQAKPEQAATDR